MIGVFSATAVATCTLGLAAFLSTPAAAQCGRASWYSMGTKTANGEPMDARGLTAAHRSLPFGTQIRVTNKSNGKSVVVRVNDRGPFAKGRLLDISKGAATQIDMISAGHASVCIAAM